MIDKARAAQTAVTDDPVLSVVSQVMNITSIPRSKIREGIRIRDSISTRIEHDFDAVGGSCAARRVIGHLPESGKMVTAVIDDRVDDLGQRAEDPCR